MNIFVNAQVPIIPSLPHSSPPTSFSKVSMTNPTGASTNAVPCIGRQNGLRQAAFWVAFRQEIYSAFMKQRPFSFPLERCDSFRTFEPAEDAVWADRLIIFCADVLQYCHGNPERPQRQSKERFPRRVREQIDNDEESGMSRGKFLHAAGGRMET